MALKVLGRLAVNVGVLTEQTVFTVTALKTWHVHVVEIAGEGSIGAPGIGWLMHLPTGVTPSVIANHAIRPILSVTNGVTIQDQFGQGMVFEAGDKMTLFLMGVTDFAHLVITVYGFEV